MRDKLGNGGWRGPGGGALLVLGVLSPALGFVLLLFLSFLPFTGIGALWETTRYPTPVLLGAVVFALLLANAVIRNDNAEASQSLVSRYGAMALGLAMLPLSAIAAVSVGVRIDAYGLMPERIWAVIFTCFAVAYGLAYARPLLRPFDRWADSVRRSNVVVAIAIGGIALLLSLQLVDFNAMSAGNQRGRLLSGKVPVERFDFAALKFDLGAPGRALLAEFKTIEGVSDAARIRKAAAEVDKLEYRWSEHLTIAEQEQREVRRRRALTSAKVYPAGVILPAALIDAVVAGPTLRTISPMCGNADVRRCAAVVADFSGDGVDDVMLFVEQCTGDKDRQSCWPTRHDLRLADGSWVQGFDVNPNTSYGRVIDNLERGDYRIEKFSRERLVVDDQPVR